MPGGRGLRYDADGPCTSKKQKVEPEEDAPGLPRDMLQYLEDSQAALQLKIEAAEGADMEDTDIAPAVDASDNAPVANDDSDANEDHNSDYLHVDDKDMYKHVRRMRILKVHNPSKTVVHIDTSRKRVMVCELW